MIQAIENAIVSRLKTQLTGLEVRSFPDKPEGFLVKGHLGSVLVRYLGSSFLTGLELGPTSLGQIDGLPGARTFQFEVALVTRGLQDHQGAYPLMEAVLESLTGYCPAGASEFLPIRDGYLGRDEGLWFFSIWFSTTTA
ncbi:MAG: hypothetical protein A2600_07535 [Candidatus Lambdaproteobacteria bacterium RIFOXYD1_FULL_56_27]|uniref:Uncharacterized protein n=1 Tax=Candidatus Lambdaproteobacteria bacterium RIFOXYD2_FULL_56_26 TaxID=1817773 RepID=A0A1F6GNB7_9PROT|nr:MAG: hypothetical protein A2557_08980 [Candidatus Lambdaproteobacteria bacterium RIFOXYD2_FULL_56_26]OGH05506.1 MAG: hypothetical protein A2426_03920 [Candidatus Lambdaproteobacteria bacterium RIFOXYC1_FULL_56_13]OGH09719.1 MAG: hypothetical protein A2600_07535 [Candidatus Lambdaproteobacteria bacterium RIFOXYD1_FULL_56_27]